MFARMGVSTDTEHMVRQLKRWFAKFCVIRSIIGDKGPPFFIVTFKAYCNKNCIDLQLTYTYNPKSFGAAKRGVVLVKHIMKKTEEEGSFFKEALAASKNTRNVSGFSPNQLFFLRNWPDPSLPSLLAEPLLVEEMVNAHNGFRASRMMKTDKNKGGWKQLQPGQRTPPANKGLEHERRGGRGGPRKHGRLCCAG